MSSESTISKGQKQQQMASACHTVLYYWATAWTATAAQNAWLIVTGVARKKIH